MKQLRIRTYYKVDYGDDNYLLDVLGGEGGPVFSSYPAPVLIPTVARNLSIFSKFTTGFTAFTIAATKNQVDTALTASLAALATSPAKDVTHSVSYAAGDLLGAHWSGTQGVFGTAYSNTLSLELEADEAQYGLNGFIGLSGGSANHGVVGGAFGNGNWQQAGSLTTFTFPSSTFAPCAVPGVITRLGGYNYGFGIDIGGRYDLYLIKYTYLGIGSGPYQWSAGVLQDGSAGTQNTLCSIIDGTPFVSTSFSLPVALGDFIDILCIRRVTNSSGATNFPKVAAAITMTPDSPGFFMNCGGDNFTHNGDPAYAWVQSYQDVTAEDNAIGIVGPNGITIHNLAVVTNRDPNPGNIDYNLRKNQVDTILVTNLSGTDRVKIVSGDVTYPEDSEIDIKVDPSPTATGGQLHWGCASEVIAPPPAAGTLIVTKVTDPTGSGQSFSFSIDGGLSPATFSLMDGETQEFDDVTPGTFDLEEDPVDDWTTSYNVSNGSPHTAITVDSEEVVTVTVTNTHASPTNIGSGIYKIVPQKRQDTLWNENFDGTTDVKIPDPFGKIAYFGD